MKLDTDKILKALLFFALCILPRIANAGDFLKIINNSESELLNFLVQGQSGPEIIENYIRLDLAPGCDAVVENPESKGLFRLDNGMDLVTFPDVDLKNAKIITIAGKNGEVLKIERDSGSREESRGSTVSLIPEPGKHPVCELSSFRPKMPMNEVCNILPEKTPVDDNGAFLAGLGFGGFVWAGRLSPEHNSPLANKALLEHMELRRPLVNSEVMSLLDYLFKQGYIPWQAEMPKAELDFADMPDKNPADRRESLLKVLDKYFENLTTETGEATIMLAPGDIVDALANADGPEKDVQLFSIFIKPKSSIVILDVSAYEGTK